MWKRYIPSHLSVDEKELTEIVMPLDGDWVTLNPLWKIIFTFQFLYKSYRKRIGEKINAFRNDWEVVTQEALEERRKQQKEEQSVDPRLASLQSFLRKG